MLGEGARLAEVKLPKVQAIADVPSKLQLFVSLAAGILLGGWPYHVFPLIASPAASP